MLDPHDDAPPAEPVPGWPVLHPTTQRAFNRILWEGGLSRAEIARQLGVSRTRLTAITRDLEDAGLVVEGGREQRSATGRPGEVLRARADAAHFLGLHCSESGTVGAVVDLENRVVWESRVDHPFEDVPALLAQCRDWLEEARGLGAKVVAAAVCAPWGTPVVGDLTGAGSALVRARRRDLEPHSGIPLWVEDDVAALTAFEQWPRMQSHQDSLVLITVGAEVGFGLISHRKLVVGAHHAAGRFGHVPVGIGSTPCPSGHRGCLAGVATTRAVVAAVPGARSLQDVAVRAGAGDAVAEEALAAAAQALGVAAGHVVNLVDPDKLLLTGGAPTLLARHGELFRRGLDSVVLTGVDVEVDVAEFDFVEWARAAAALAVYRTLSPVEN